MVMMDADDMYIYEKGGEDGKAHGSGYHLDLEVTLVDL